MEPIIGIQSGFVWSTGTGQAGANGWTPIFAVVADSDRRVLQVADWIGGGGTKPAIAQFVGPTGFVDTAAEAVDIRGQAGSGGGSGDGDNGWSPVLSLVTDGARRVLQVSDWVGGEGTKPITGQYVGPTGLVSTVAAAVDIRGPQGIQGIQGPKGDQGDQGPKGDQGDEGPQGAQGDEGPQGGAGPEGDAGPAGRSVQVFNSVPAGGGFGTVYFAGDIVKL